jgi:D-alanyl-D-alanine carboxypeptidase
MVSLKTGEPIAEVTPEDPQGFALGLAQGVLGPLGNAWFYQGMTLGYRTLYVWFEQDGVLVTVQTNSQPNDDVNRLHEAAAAIHAALEAP